MFKKRQKSILPSPLFVVMGQLLAILNETQPIPAPDELLQTIQTLQTQARQGSDVQHLQQLAVLVKTALRQGTYVGVDEGLRKALAHLQSLVPPSDTGVPTDDPRLVGKQVVYRFPEENEIIYGRIESTLVFSTQSALYDTWAVHVRPGFNLVADSNAFVLYDGPPYQPGEHLLYQEESASYMATILGSGFGLRGCFGFNIVFQRRGKQEYRSAVPSMDLVAEE